MWIYVRRRTDTEDCQSKATPDKPDPLEEQDKPLDKVSVVFMVRFALIYAYMYYIGTGTACGARYHTSAACRFLDCNARNPISDSP